MAHWWGYSDTNGPLVGAGGGRVRAVADDRVAGLARVAGSAGRGRHAACTTGAVAGPDDIPDRRDRHGESGPAIRVVGAAATAATAGACGLAVVAALAAATAATPAAATAATACVGVLDRGPAKAAGAAGPAIATRRRRARGAARAATPFLPPVIPRPVGAGPPAPPAPPEATPPPLVWPPPPPPPAKLPSFDAPPPDPGSATLVSAASPASPPMPPVLSSLTKTGRHRHRHRRRRSAWPPMVIAVRLRRGQPCWRCRRCRSQTRPPPLPASRRLPRRRPPRRGDHGAARLDARVIDAGDRRRVAAGAADERALRVELPPPPPPMIVKCSVRKPFGMVPVTVPAIDPVDDCHRRAGSRERQRRRIDSMLMTPATAPPSSMPRCSSRRRSRSPGTPKQTADSSCRPAATTSSRLRPLATAIAGRSRSPSQQRQTVAVMPRGHALRPAPARRRRSRRRSVARPRRGRAAVPSTTSGPLRAASSNREGQRSFLTPEGIGAGEGCLNRPSADTRSADRRRFWPVCTALRWIGRFARAGRAARSDATVRGSAATRPRSPPAPAAVTS